MQEIRFHGRGGQGAVIGSELLAHAFFLEDRYVQAFPSFGVERRGAPVTAFCRIDDGPIHLRNQIYTPDHVVVLDASLLQTVGVTEGLKPDGTVLINGRQPASTYGSLLGPGFRVFAVDAAGVAVRHRLGSPSNPIVNTAIVGAFARATGLLSVSSVEQAIEAYVPRKKAENRRAAREAFDAVRSA
ncbi:MAG: 2-oxoacid:acceptor oxidoreductase family protein [Desulfobacteraceae bacterium]|jgi:2-oxoacid:acceptor oxidoreductase gamma subunit (pyruvate/2-ketoisovalerate family)|nr:2-oxoacid:acceptor oxidoreductase family protein [Desulfobacteraceae bacterium]